MISENFYSIQGEGVSAGVPSYFIRLSQCNLMCGGKNGSLMNKGDATWWCDSEAVWRKKTDITPENIFLDWIEKDILYSLMEKGTHLIWTGGEPLISKNVKYIQNFYNEFDVFMETAFKGVIDLMTEQEKSDFDGIDHSKRFLYDGYKSFFTEVETNGTMLLPDDIKFTQINCSPKLKNSGMSDKRRIVPEALQKINEHRNSWFKFVVSNEKDLDEIYLNFIFPGYVDHTKVILMPSMTKQSEFFERTKWLFELGKEHNFRVMPRLHIAAWDMVTGV